MDYIADGGSSTVSIDDEDHLLLANRKCVIYSPSNLLTAYDLLPVADDVRIPVQHARGEGFQLRRTNAPQLKIEGHHFVGDINAEGTVGAYAVTHVNTRKRRTSHLYLFDAVTMTNIGNAKQLESEFVTNEDVAPPSSGRMSISGRGGGGGVPDKWQEVHWQRARNLQTLLRVCLSPNGQRVAVIMYADAGEPTKRVLVFRRQENNTLRKEFDIDIGEEGFLMEGTVHWSSTEGGAETLRWLQRDGKNKLDLVTHQLQEGGGWITMENDNASITLDQGRRFANGGKIVPYAREWYANVEVKGDGRVLPNPWFQVEIALDGSIRLLESEEEPIIEGEISEHALLNLPSQDFAIRGPVAIWGPRRSLCVIKRLDAEQDRRLAFAMGQHLRLGEDSILKQFPREIFDGIRPYIIARDCPRAY